MIEFVEYSDEKISIKLPKQLRQKRPIRFFRGNLVRGKPETRMSVILDLDLDAHRVEVIKGLLLRPEIKNRPPNEKLERVGPCEFGEDGMELLTCIMQPHTGYTLYFWDLIYNLHGTYILFTIMGSGSRESFETIATKIITSLTLISPSQSKKRLNASTGSMIKNIKHGGLKAKEKAHLASALKSLPNDLMYLRDPILAIADEDQDLLGCGEVDTKLLAESIEQQADLQPSGFATDQSKKLEKWLKSNTSKKDTWAGPVWFVMAFLMGYEIFHE